MSDSQKSEKPLPQDAFRNVPFTDEDAYFAEQEKLALEQLKKERESRQAKQRLCLSQGCTDKVLEVVEIDNVEIDRCPDCGGVWLDPGELELLLKRAKGSKNSLAKFFYSLAGREE